MTRSVWKFSLSDAPAIIKAPEGARFVFVDMHGSRPCVWAEVDTARPTRRYTFHVVGIGWDVAEGSHYIGTAHDREGGYLWHVYGDASNGDGGQS